MGATLHIEEKRNDTKLIFLVLMDAYNSISKQYPLTVMNTGNHYPTIRNRKTKKLFAKPKNNADRP